MSLADIPFGATLRLRDGQIVSIVVRGIATLLVRNEVTGQVREIYPYAVAEVIA